MKEELYNCYCKLSLRWVHTYFVCFVCSSKEWWRMSEVIKVKRTNFDVDHSFEES